ncbi:SIR2 family NAD-dependent protein deacylase [Planctomyces sp. SH-PL62]|uniref:SIR2 family NAD-dependent protein deacylase n=1 Tax=Planctomyces sp. SH-PL62 TaxID=1636152 RepID=UPI00078BDBF6|nr:Sir2 family NAD-dependent protein deacetylase [Planctomyces sp. SH-PL62]AMV40681.1 NAD-dependent protein deacetylase [Planctomyces sp. SH-PL62]
MSRDHDAAREIERAAEAVATADAILITAGAGMGVDSGLPDFRGREGFWNAYPPYAALGLDFVALASPRWFRADPDLAWGFYGHRLLLYRRARPHEGFAILKRWAGRAPRGGFVFTSNVDGQFQRAGFPDDGIAEAHGAIDFLQCLDDCGEGIFPFGGRRIMIDLEAMRAVGDLPACPRCGALARPNILMFGDSGWDGSRSDEQDARLRAWFRAAAESEPRARLVVVECGAGTAVPTVRRLGERVAALPNATLVRINPRDADAPPGAVSIASGALDALRAIDRLIPS